MQQTPEEDLYSQNRPKTLIRKRLCAVFLITPRKRRRVRKCSTSPQPALTLLLRPSLFRVPAGVQTVCRACRGSSGGNGIGKVAAHPAAAGQNSLANSSGRARFSHTKRSPKVNLRSVQMQMSLIEQIIGFTGWLSDTPYSKHKSRDDAAPVPSQGQSFLFDWASI